MASERARRFAAGLVTKRRFPLGGYDYCEAFGLVSEVVPVCDEDHDNAIAAIAAALDRYEAEAWTAITDDPGSWPPEGEAVLSLLADGKMRVWAIRVDDCGCCAWWGSNGRPTHWRPLPAPPRGGV